MTTDTDQSAIPNDYRRLFQFTDQLLLWLAERDPSAYQEWATAFTQLDGHDVGISNRRLYERIQTRVGPLERSSLVLHFVPDPERTARWWHEHIHPTGYLFDDDGYWGITLDACELGFHPAHEAKNPHGASTVAYWPVTSLDTTRTRLMAAGCQPLRGPLEIDAGRSICQLVDPHEITFGLEGPR